MPSAHRPLAHTASRVHAAPRGHSGAQTPSSQKHIRVTRRRARIPASLIGHVTRWRLYPAVNDGATVPVDEALIQPDGDYSGDQLH